MNFDAHYMYQSKNARGNHGGFQTLFLNIFLYFQKSFSIQLKIEITTCHCFTSSSAQIRKNGLLGYIYVLSYGCRKPRLRKIFEIHRTPNLFLSRFRDSWYGKRL